jgi:uncharacterized iron-regulated protein
MATEHPTMNAFSKTAASQPTTARRTLPWLPVVVLVAAALQIGCASFPAPNEQMALTTAAVASAERAGAVALAPAEMALARDKLARANASMVEEKYERALMLAEAAQVDARLAEAKARSTQAGKAATELREGNRVLRQEIERGTQ